MIFFPSMLIELDRYPPLVCPGWTSIPASPSSRNPPKNPDSSDSPPHCQVTCSAPGGGKALVTWKSWVSEFAFAQRECLFFLNSCDWDLLWQEVRMLEILREHCGLNMSLLGSIFLCHNLSYPSIYKSMLCNAMLYLNINSTVTSSPIWKRKIFKNLGGDFIVDLSKPCNCVTSAIVCTSSKLLSYI